QVRRTVAGAAGAARPEWLSGVPVVGNDGFTLCRLPLRAGVDDDEPVVDERRTAHAPLNVVVVGEDVRLPFDRAGRAVEALEPAGRAERVNVAVGNGRRRPRAIAPERLAEMGWVAVDPA